MRFWQIPSSKKDKTHSEEIGRKILYLKVAIALVIITTLGYAAYIAIYMSSQQELHPINWELLPEGEWKQEFPLETYIDGPVSLTKYIYKDTTKEKFLRLNAVNSNGTYSGVTFYLNRHVPEDSRLALTWRGSGQASAIITDVMDGSKIDSSGTGDSAVVWGQNFYAELLAPESKWNTISIAIDTLTLNPNQPSGKIKYVPFNFNMIRQVSVSILPNSNFTLDIKDIYFYWEVDKWPLAGILLIIGLVGFLLDIRTKPEKLLLENGTTLKSNALFSRIAFCLVAISAALAIFIYGTLFLTPANLALYSALFLLIIADEFLVFTKTNPFWSLRYAVVLFTGYLMGFSGGILSVCLILIAAYIPLVKEKIQELLWSVIVIAILIYIAEPHRDTHFTFLAGLILILAASAIVIIFKGYLQQQEKDFMTEQTMLQYEALFKKTSDAIFVLSENGTIVTANQSFERLTGYPLNELKGESILCFICLESEEVIKRMLLATDENDNGQYDIHFANKSGNIKTALVRYSAIYKNNQRTGVQALATDITERKIAEEKLATTVKLLENKSNELVKLNDLLKQSEEQLRDSNIRKDKFFSIISHDLRNPFHSLMGLSDLIANDFENLSKEDIKLFATNIKSSTKNLYKLLENLLQWASMQTGKMVYRSSSINLSDLVETVIGVVKGNAERKNIRLCSKIAKEIAVYADYNSIHSVIQNLVTNAIKFTNPGGEVSIYSVTRGRMVEITVADTGIGMTRQDLEKLFRIDVHHSTVGTSEEMGTGLGLILCKEMVENNGGTIRAESEPGQGSRFIFTLPESALLS